MANRILETATRHYVDGAGLVAAGKTKSGLLLLIFSYELVGKALMKKNKTKGRGKHSKKQAHASTHLAMATILEAYFREGVLLVHESDPRVKIVEDEGWEADAGIDDKVEKKVNDSPIWKLVDAGTNNKLYEMRTAILYGDGPEPTEKEVDEMSALLLEGIPLCVKFYNLHEGPNVADEKWFRP